MTQVKRQQRLRLRNPLDHFLHLQSGLENPAEIQMLQRMVQGDEMTEALEIAILFNRVVRNVKVTQIHMVPYTLKHTLRLPW